MTVRLATEADLEAVAASEAEGFGADAWSPALVVEGLTGRLPTVTFLVAEDAGRVVGHAVVSLVDDVAELQRIAVAPDARRRGLASALLAEVLDLAGPAGAVRLLLEVREHNTAALAFYAAHGFTELARRPRYYRDGTAAVVLERPVRMGS